MKGQGGFIGLGCLTGTASKCNGPTGYAASPLGRRQMIDRTKETKVIAFETQSL